MGIQLQTADLRKLVFNFQLLTARHFDFATKITKGVSRKQQRSRLKTSQEGSAAPRGPSQVPTSFHGFPRAFLPGGFPPWKLSFFRVFRHFSPRETYWGGWSPPHASARNFHLPTFRSWTSATQLGRPTSGSCGSEVDVKTLEVGFGIK